MDNAVICIGCGTSANIVELRNKKAIQRWSQINSHTKFVKLQEQGYKCIRCYNDDFETAYAEFSNDKCV